MSVQAVNQFLQKVSEDEKLQQELAQTLQSDEEGKVAATELAAKHGYQFSPDELWQEIQNRQSEFETKQSSGELNEEELESVAGGTSPLIAAGIGAAGAIGGGLAGRSKW